MSVVRLAVIGSLVGAVVGAGAAFVAALLRPQRRHPYSATRKWA